MNKYIKALLIGTICCGLANVAKAQLLGVNPSYPLINFVNNDPTAVSYDPASQTLTINALPYNIVFSESDAGDLIVNNNTISIALNTDGTLLSGASGFSLTGQFTRVLNGVTNTYSGLLLQGDVTGFGYEYVGGDNLFDFTIQLTGGQIQSLFGCAPLFGLTMSSEASTFTNSFATAFNGGAKGYCGPDEVGAPTITCPPLSEVLTTATTDTNTGNPGFLITYPNPVVTDPCDPQPSLYCDTPSGSVVDLNPGDTLTINCYGINVSGNYSVCSFTVTMGQQVVGPCTLGFPNGPCAPTTLPTDSGVCYATYSFALPEATNCTGQTFAATATAVSETGVAITLTTLPNGMVQGAFPHTLTSTGDVITFTATDGMGNSVVQQCQVLVKDNQAPVIACLNQTATFKPILTNAVNSITACFNNQNIPKGDYLWFQSDIQNLSCQRNQAPFVVHIFGQTIVLVVDNTNLTLNVPDAYVIFSNNVPVATTAFVNGEWMTTNKINCSGNTFMSGLAWELPFNLNNIIGNCWGRDRNEPYRRMVTSVTWNAQFAVSSPSVVLQWQWSAVVSSKLPTDYNACGVKPVDDNNFCSWRNNDPAGSCENYKNCLLPGACGQGCRLGGWQGPDCTGILSSVRRCNLGLGPICEGAVDFTTPKATDNCDSTVTVTCNPPSGSVFGPGVQLITCTAVDSSGNKSECSFTLTVVPPLQVIFDSPSCDNIADNISEPDKGYTEMNCPDTSSGPQYVNCFHVGSTVCHVVRLLDCGGNDVTSTVGPCVTVHIDITERQGTYGSSTLICDIPPTYNWVGCAGGIMVPCGENFQYNMSTTGFQSGTFNTSRFFRACAWVEYNSSPGVPVGMEDVILESY